MSVVVPVHNEAEVLEELVSRIRAAAPQAELVLVDDASTDGSAELLAARAPDERVRVVTLEENLGQFRATCAGLSAAAGDRIVVLDGDLQDPPEVIPALVAALGDADVAFAVKTSRKDPLWFRVGRVLYQVLAGLGRGVPPSGAGSYCVMTRGLAARVVTVPWPSVNLAAVIVSFADGHSEWPTVGYAKAERYDGRSRVGFVGLVKEATGSLRVTGALARLVGAAALLGAVILLWAFGA